jgi:hypothetical protein
MGGMTSAGPGGMSSRMGAMMGLPGRSGPTGMSGMAMGGPPPGVGPMMSGRSMGGMIGGAMSEGGMTTLGGGAAGTTDLSPAGEGEVSWVYEKGTDTKVFLFNKDGLVIQIQSFGYKGATRTSSGVALGDVTRKVYAVYGWPDSVISSGDTMTLSYGKKANVAFQLVDRHNGQGMRVVGITVALTEAPKQP